LKVTKVAESRMEAGILFQVAGTETEVQMGICGTRPYDRDQGQFWPRG